MRARRRRPTGGRRHHAARPTAVSAGARGAGGQVEGRSARTRGAALRERSVRIAGVSAPGRRRERADQARRAGRIRDGRLSRSVRTAAARAPDRSAGRIRAGQLRCRRGVRFIGEQPMQGDFERVTFDPTDAFANVLLQQGRLLLPADFNELGAILQNALRQYIVDAHTSDWQVDDGFKITVTPGATLTFKIKEGRYYVDGLRCHNAAELEYGAAQPFWQKPDDLDNLAGANAIVYLHCWDRHVSWLQCGRLREVALDGLDTATRVQVAWQVRAESDALLSKLEEVKKALKAQLAAGGDKPALNARIKEIDDLKKLFDTGMTVAQADTILDEIDGTQNRGTRPRMAADAKEDVANPDPCTIAPDSEYRGRENQLYRVEIHKPGTASDATFKWSRENGSVALRVLDVVVADKETDVTVESLGRDRRTGIYEDDWVELVDDDLELNWTTTPLLQVSKVDVQRRVVTLKGKAIAPDPARHAILRRWDHHTDDEASGTLEVVEAKNDTSWIELERGIRIRFTAGGYYRKGDYWLIPARVATGDIEWPADAAGEPKAIEPHGITHHRAVLALVTKTGGKWEEKQ